MDIKTIKQNLRSFYNQEAEQRNAGERHYWKHEARNIFRDLCLANNKRTLLELGAGPGHDSAFFMENGFDVTAVDLSCEMVRLCREKGINAHELDFYNLGILNCTYDCVWAMNSLLHVPKADLPNILQDIDAILNDGGLFFMVVYGGVDAEQDRWFDSYDAPRFFASYSKANLRFILQNVFDIIQFEEFDVGRGADLQQQMIFMRKKALLL